MADHRRTIQIRIYEESSSEVSPNKGLVPAWRVQAEDRVWFVRCTNGEDVREKAIFKDSPFESQKLEIPFELLPTTGAPANEQTVAAGLKRKSFAFTIETNPSELLKGQIDIDP